MVKKKKSSYIKKEFDFRRKYSSENREIYAYFRKAKVEAKRRKTDNFADFLTSKEIYQQFKNTTKEFRQEGYTIRESLEKTTRTRSYRSQEEHYKDIFIEEIKKNKKIYNQLREDSKVKGHFAPIKWDTLKYRGSKEVLGQIWKIYTIETEKGLRWILRKNSPKDDSHYELVYSANPLD